MIYQHPWCGVLRPNLPDLPQFPKYTKTGRYTSTLRWSLPWSKASFDVKCGVKHFEWLSMYQYPWCGVLGLNLPDLPQFAKYTKTGITQSSDGLYPWVKLHLMWSMEFNTLDDFLCISAHNHISCPSFTNTQEQI